jgi:hypothetical protein
VVQTRENLLLIGYISRTDIQWALDRARKVYGIIDNAPCYFYSQHYPFQLANTTQPQNSSILVDVPASTTSPHIPYNTIESPLVHHLDAPVSVQGAPFGEEGQFRAYLNFSPWIDRTPLTIPDNYSMDLTLELFKKLGELFTNRCIFLILEGLRFVLVCKHVSNEFFVQHNVGSTSRPPGFLFGLITKKDVLRCIEQVDRMDENQRPRIADATRTRGDSTVSNVPSISLRGPRRRSHLIGNSNLHTRSPLVPPSQRTSMDREHSEEFIGISGSTHTFTRTTPNKDTQEDLPE